jgi:hypothetical protein
VERASPASTGKQGLKSVRGCGGPSTSESDKGSKSWIATRPARLSETVRGVSTFAEPVRRKDPGRRSRSTTHLATEQSDDRERAQGFHEEGLDLPSDHGLEFSRRMAEFQALSPGSLIIQLPGTQRIHTDAAGRPIARLPFTMTCGAKRRQVHPVLRYPTPEYSHGCPQKSRRAAPSPHF